MTDDAQRLAEHAARRGTGKKKPEAVKTYRQQLGFDRFHDIVLDDWFVKLKPAGSGPLGVMRMACALIEEIRDLRAERLGKVPAVLPAPMHGSREDVLARTSLVMLGGLRNPEAKHRDERFDKLATHIEELASLAAIRTEGEAIYMAMCNGYTVTKTLPWGALTDEANARNAWMVKRQEAPYGCYKIHEGKREFVNSWNGPTATEAITQAMADMSAPGATQD
jgi:hypothetical protein